MSGPHKVGIVVPVNEQCLSSNKHWENGIFWLLASSIPLAAAALGPAHQFGCQSTAAMPCPKPFLHLQSQTLGSCHRIASSQLCVPAWVSVVSCPLPCGLPSAAAPVSGRDEIYLRALCPMTHGASPGGILAFYAIIHVLFAGSTYF